MEGIKIRCIKGYHHHLNGDITMVESSKTFKSIGDRIIRVEDALTDQKLLYEVYLYIVEWAKKNQLSG